MERKQMRVDGMTCGGCESTLTRAVSQINGVQEATADHTTGAVVVTFDPRATDVAAIESAIEDAGYDVVRA